MVKALKLYWPLVILGAIGIGFVVFARLYENQARRDFYMEMVSREVINQRIRYLELKQRQNEAKIRDLVEALADHLGVPPHVILKREVF